MLVRHKSLEQKIDDKGCDGPSCAVRLLVVIFTYKSLKRGKKLTAVNRGLRYIGVR